MAADRDGGLVARRPRPAGHVAVVGGASRRGHRGARAGVRRLHRRRSSHRCGGRCLQAVLPGLPQPQRRGRRRLAGAGRTAARRRAGVGDPRLAARLPVARRADGDADRGGNRDRRTGDGGRPPHRQRRRALPGDELQRDRARVQGRCAGRARAHRRGGGGRVDRPARAAHRERHLLQHDLVLPQRRGPRARGAVGRRGRALDAPPVASVATPGSAGSIGRSSRCSAATGPRRSRRPARPARSSSATGCSTRSASR